MFLDRSFSQRLHNFSVLFWRDIEKMNFQRKKKKKKKIISIKIYSIIFDEYALTCTCCTRKIN